MHITLCLGMLLAFGVRAQAQTNESVAILESGARLEKVASGFKFTEGPTCDASGNVFFTDQPNDRILKWDVTSSKLTTFLQPSGRANGMCFDAKGNLIACCDEKTALWSISPDGKQTVLASQFNGKALNGPNDVWVHPKGGYYLTDPFYPRTWWKYDKLPQDGEYVYYLSADAKTFKRVVEDLKQPNGVTGTPDGKTLYVADIGAWKTYAFDIQEDGTLANKRLICSIGADGITLDTAGNLYLSGNGVTVVNSSGTQIAHIDVPAKWTANVSFGGKDHRTLFITAGESLYSIRTRNAGANPAK